MNPDTLEWMFNNKNTIMKKISNEEIIHELRLYPHDSLVLDWCLLMLAGNLGSIDMVKEYYPELFV